MKASFKEQRPEEKVFRPFDITIKFETEEEATKFSLLFELESTDNHLGANSRQVILYIMKLAYKDANGRDIASYFSK